MARFVISHPARADLASILTTSLERWGEQGRARYAALLTASMRKVAGAPLGPTTKAQSDLAPGLRSFHLRHARQAHGVGAPVRVLYYRVTVEGSIEIMRVLHERMDPRRHVGMVRTRRAGRRRDRP